MLFAEEFIRSYLRKEPLTRWVPVMVAAKSKTLMSDPLPSGASEPLALSGLDWR